MTTKQRADNEHNEPTRIRNRAPWSAPKLRDLHTAQTAFFGTQTNDSGPHTSS
jgi:hypothetical protein